MSDCYWNIKFYDGQDELETVRGLNEIQKHALVEALKNQGLVEKDDFQALKCRKRDVEADNQ